MSAFTPVNKELYSVIESIIMNEFVVSRTPSSEVCCKSPKPVKVIPMKLKRREKKYWSPEQKKIAISRASVLGLSKATRMLQNEMPSIFGDLSPSTLQYWVQKQRTEHNMC
ncbi:hypothetical protein EIN_380780 [Entamoeba invadens IP1]|uniref:Uncharacterized protein n=1 Tax=Entamoeba invadens IP1 TaxID=370355 RepID=A0A0A1UEB8_ENTIV|nr:hypothetical protein EIN_380780 [Entamoeba invadens IP1]ELP92131.1 hypothetical protein EIN_380780 [Entamoeba invadens IP1]|eukprot:XP_004258902.1 hypothetical protein EIN_380780 [Entamoeba invadens IP1]